MNSKVLLFTPLSKGLCTAGKVYLTQINRSNESMQHTRMGRIHNRTCICSDISSDVWAYIHILRYTSLHCSTEDWIFHVFKIVCFLQISINSCFGFVQCNVHKSILETSVNDCHHHISNYLASFRLCFVSIYIFKGIHKSPIWCGIYFIIIQKWIINDLHSSQYIQIEWTTKLHCI